MFNVLFNLPHAIPSLLSSLHRGKKRRVALPRHCCSSVEDLEARQLLSAANSVSDHAGVPRIINGTTTSSFTAVGQLTYTPTGGTAVGSTGTLIATQWVLTSATASQGLTTTGGAATVILGGVTYTVDQIVIYPKYNSTSIELKQDLALWHLTAAVPGTITPLAYTYTKPSANSTVTLVGFGLTGTGTTGATAGTYGTKQTATTKLERVSPSILAWKLDSNSEGTTAAGDNGSPILKNVSGVYTVVGIAAGHSTSTQKIGDLAYNTRVDLYAGWIDNTISRAHPAVTAVDDFIDTADTVGTTNRTFNLSSTATSFSVKGKLTQYGDVDVFKVVAATSGFATFTVTNNLASSQLFDTKLELLASNGTTVLFTTDDNTTTDFTSQFSTVLAAGTYFVRVSSYSNAFKGEYTLGGKVLLDNVGDTTGTAKTLTGTSLGVFSADVVINTTTDVDYYKITLTKTGTYQFDFTKKNPGTLDPTISVYTSAGVLIDTNDDYSSGIKNSRLVLDGLTSGTVLYVKVSGVSGSVGLGQFSARKI